MGVTENQRLGTTAGLGIHTGQAADTEGAGLAGAGLGLSQDVAPLNERHRRNGLNGRRLLITVGIDAPEEFVGKGHVIKLRATGKFLFAGSLNNEVGVGGCRRGGTGGGGSSSGRHVVYCRT